MKGAFVDIQIVLHAIGVCMDFVESWLLSMYRHLWIFDIDSLFDICAAVVVFLIVWTVSESRRWRRNESVVVLIGSVCLYVGAAVFIRPQAMVFYTLLMVAMYFEVEDFFALRSHDGRTKESK